MTGWSGETDRRWEVGVRGKRSMLDGVLLFDQHQEVEMEFANQVGAERLAPVGRRPALWLTVRGLGALAVIAVGLIHLQQYLERYSEIPTIGTLFVLNFAGATAIGLGLLAPVERIVGRRWGGAALGLLALAGIGLAATAFVFLMISERTPLFGFMEPGYDPAAILASRVAEGGAILLLGGFFFARFIARVPMGRW
jgi:hypothetical protein